MTGAGQENSQAELIADLETLNQISLSLNQSVDVQSALDESLARLVQLMGLESGWIFMKDDATVDSWWGKGYILAAHFNLPPAMRLNNPDAWKGGCDCQGFCNKGKLTEAYNEVRCTRLGDVTGDKHGLVIHASAPLVTGDRALGILNVAALTWDDFDPRSLALLSNVGAQIGVALERAYLFDLLKERRINEQAALLELSNQLLSRLDFDDLMIYLVEEVSRLARVDAAAILLPDADPDRLVFQAAAGWTHDPAASKHFVPSDERSGPGQVMQRQQPLIIGLSGPVEALSPGPVEWFPAEGFLATAIIPLVSEERSIGALIVSSRQQRVFDEDEIRFLQLMANQTAIAIEKARLQENEIIRQQLEKELAVGRQIQMSLLPKSCPTKPGWEFCDIYEAAHQVGGDFYDFFEIPGEAGQLGLVIADVSDKGVPAALFMGVSRTLIRSAALSGLGPAATLEEANRLILHESQSGLFLSAFYGVLNLHNGKLDYCNAGHNPPLLYSPMKGEIQKLTTKGIVMCVLEEIRLEEKQVEVSSGDVLIFYTDGVTEAMNADLEEFGDQRLKEAVIASAKGSATQFLNAIVDSVRLFTGDMDQSDDFTLYIVKRL